MGFLDKKGSIGAKTWVAPTEESRQWDLKKRNITEHQALEKAKLEENSQRMQDLREIQRRQEKLNHRKSIETARNLQMYDENARRMHALDLAYHRNDYAHQRRAIAVEQARRAELRHRMEQDLHRRNAESLAARRQLAAARSALELRERERQARAAEQLRAQRLAAVHRNAARSPISPAFTPHTPYSPYVDESIAYGYQQFSPPRARARRISDPPPVSFRRSPLSPATPAPWPATDPYYAPHSPAPQSLFPEYSANRLRRASFDAGRQNDVYLAQQRQQAEMLAQQRQQAAALQQQQAAFVLQHGMAATPRPRPRRQSTPVPGNWRQSALF